MLTARGKKVRLNTPQALIEQLKECSHPTHYPKYETDRISLTHSMSKKDCISLIEDYELMKKHLKECGYKINALWAIGLDGSITRTKRGEEEYLKSQMKPRKRLKKPKRKKLKSR